MAVEEIEEVLQIVAEISAQADLLPETRTVAPHEWEARTEASRIASWRTGGRRRDLRRALLSVRDLPARPVAIGPAAD